MYPLRDGYPVINLGILYSGADLHHYPRRIVPQNKGQSSAIITAILADLQVQGAIDRNRVDPNQNFAGVWGGSRHLLPLEHFGTAILMNNDRFQYKTYP